MLEDHVAERRVEVDAAQNLECVNHRLPLSSSSSKSSWHIVIVFSPSTQFRAHRMLLFWLKSAAKLSNASPSLHNFRRCFSMLALLHVNSDTISCIAFSLR